MLVIQALLWQHSTFVFVVPIAFAEGVIRVANDAGPMTVVLVTAETFEAARGPDAEGVLYDGPAANFSEC